MIMKNVLTQPRCLFVVFMLLSCCVSFATTPDPFDESNQEMLRQQERERLLQQQQQPRPDVRLQEPTTPGSSSANKHVNESPCFQIDSILLAGEDASDFQWALPFADFDADGASDPSLHRCLGTQGINLLMRRMQNAIMQKGFVTTRVLAEHQDLSSGTLSLIIISGRIHAIRFANPDDWRSRQWNALPMRAGDLLNLRDIEQGLENFKRVPTAEADIQIVPAEGSDAGPGTSDLVIDWKQRFPIRGNISIDDSGAKTTGKYIGTSTLSWDHFLTLNDLMYVSLNHDLGGDNSGDKGTQGGTFHYSLPLGYWSMDFTASQNRYHQRVAGATEDYQYSGESDNGNLKLSRMLYRDATQKTSASLGGWLRSSKNYIDDTEVEVQRRRMVGWEAGINNLEYIGPAILDIKLNYRRGTGALDALPAPEELFNEGTSRPGIVSGDITLDLPFALSTQQFKYKGTVRGQWNETPLIVQDCFSIGGRATIRGFNGENTLMAERGWLMRHDMGWLLNEKNLETYIGVDYGEVSGTRSAYLVGRHLSGAALGIRGAFKALHYDFFIGTPLDKPKGFEADNLVTGFSLSWNF